MISEQRGPSRWHWVIPRAAENLPASHSSTDISLVPVKIEDDSSPIHHNTADESSTNASNECRKRPPTYDLETTSSLPDQVKREHDCQTNNLARSLSDNDTSMQRMKEDTHIPTSRKKMKYAREHSEQDTTTAAASSVAATAAFAYTDASSASTAANSATVASSSLLSDGLFRKNPRNFVLRKNLGMDVHRPFQKSAASVSEPKSSWQWLLAAQSGQHSPTERIKVDPGDPPLKKAPKRLKPAVELGWYWLKNPDGTPAMARNSSSRKRSATKRRKVGDLPRFETPANPKPRVFKTEQGYKDMSIDNDNDSKRSSFPHYISEEQHAQWEENFQLLVEYKNKHQTTNVPKNYPTLGTWIGRHRYNYKGQRLTIHRRQKLEAIGFVFDTYAAYWTEMYNQLLLYKEQHGSVDVPRWTNKERNIHWKLATWMQSQRKRFRAGKLSKERKKLLDSVGIDWKLQAGTNFNQDAWMTMYARLVKYKKINGHTKVPKGYKADPELGNWVTMQRARCIDVRRKRLLNDIGFTWDVKKEDWMLMYGRLKDYKKKFKTAHVPLSFEDQKLAVWVRLQRTNCVKKERIRLLNKIGFVWDPLKNGTLEKPVVLR